MKMRALLCALVALVAPRRAGAMDVARGLDAERMLGAIAEAETGGSWRAIGPKGERGRCQFLYRTWIRYTTASFTGWASHDCPLTRQIEQAHLAYLIRHLCPYGQVPEPALIAAAWHFGERHATRNVRSDYARRVANLYWDSVRNKL